MLGTSLSTSHKVPKAVQQHWKIHCYQTIYRKGIEVTEDVGCPGLYRAWRMQLESGPQVHIALLSKRISLLLQHLVKVLASLTLLVQAKYVWCATPEQTVSILLWHLAAQTGFELTILWSAETTGMSHQTWLIYKMHITLKALLLVPERYQESNPRIKSALQVLTRLWERHREHTKREKRKKIAYLY